METQKAIKETSILIEKIDSGIKSLTEKIQNSYSNKFSSRTFEAVLERVAKSTVVLSYQLKRNKLKSSVVISGFTHNSHNQADRRRERVLTGTQVSLKR